MRKQRWEERERVERGRTRVCSAHDAAVAEALDLLARVDQRGPRVAALVEPGAEAVVAHFGRARVHDARAHAERHDQVRVVQVSRALALRGVHDRVARVADAAAALVHLVREVELALDPRLAVLRLVALACTV